MYVKCKYLRSLTTNDDLCQAPLNISENCWRVSSEFQMKGGIDKNSSIDQYTEIETSITS